MLYIGMIALILLLGVGIKIRNGDRKKQVDKELRENINEVLLDKFDVYLEDYNSKIEKIILEKLTSPRTDKLLQKQINNRIVLSENLISNYQFDKENSINRIKHDEIDEIDEIDVITQNILLRRKPITKHYEVSDIINENDSFIKYNNRIGVKSDERDTRIFNEIFKKNRGNSTS